MADSLSHLDDLLKNIKAVSLLSNTVKVSPTYLNRSPTFPQSSR